jgi:hypothetical protein
MQNYLNIVKLLLSYGADPHVKDDYEVAPIDVACGIKHYWNGVRGFIERVPYQYPDYICCGVK